MGQTPMIKQYLTIKEQYKDAIIFFRLGDFYEMFFEDAVEAAGVLEIALTSRGSDENRIPMCGVPYHAYEGYAAKLLTKGYKIAICEQMEDPAQAKGIVRREVIRVISPGTIMDEKVLWENKNNYLVAVVQEKHGWGLACADISTGEFKITQSLQGEVALLDELRRLNPAELVLREEHRGEAYVEEIGACLLCTASWVDLQTPDLQDSMQCIDRELNLTVPAKEELYYMPLATMAAHLLLVFLKNTQKHTLGHLTRIETYRANQYMLLDEATRRNLEITENIHSNSAKGSLLGVLDETTTSMGARKLKQWLEAPLLDLTEIQDRLAAVEELVSDVALREQFKQAIKGIYDLERLLGRISYGTAGPRDLVALKQSVGRLPELANALTCSNNSRFQRYLHEMDLLEDVYTLLEQSLVEEPPINLRDGNIFKEGFHAEVDKLRTATRDGKQWLAQLEASEKEKTGIRSLKIGFNKVFGYYIEVTKANLALVPGHYHRKQTLTNAERFVTSELKEKEALILGATDRLKTLEFHLFQELRQQLEAVAGRIQKSAVIVAELDVFIGLATVAVKNNYSKPRMEESSKLELVGARHPVVEKLMKDRFVPNDYFLHPPADILNIITGPNMAGKSTYIRAAAIVIIMAQIGSFVPADMATIGLVDRVFARVGASDDLSTGQSTFMVEMNEVANILNNAGPRSFVILDEVGRGTSTFDGISIAWAVSEYILGNLQARTFFATHYHELAELKEYWPAVTNLSMAVEEQDNRIVFLRKVVKGSADRSYGIHVAELAGLPSQVTNRAYQKLKALENKGNGSDSADITDPDQKHHTAPAKLATEIGKAFFAGLTGIEPNEISPIEAWHLLHRYRDKAKDLWQQLQEGGNE